MKIQNIPDKWRWFPDARFGLFIHWGPYALYERGEQVLMREWLDQAEYAGQACRWNPDHFDARRWAEIAVQGGFRYAVFTTRHHDGFCLWNSRLTDYTSVAQAAKRDFVAEYVEAFRAAGLRVGLYYSLADFRVPAYFEGPQINQSGWNAFCEYAHGQVRELLTNYGKIDVFWFDGAWPRSREEWRAGELIRMMRSLQPDILINNRLGKSYPQTGAAAPVADGGMIEDAGHGGKIGDFGTPEHQIVAESDRLWESCQVSTWRLWGYTIGERWRPADLLLDMLVEIAGKGGNLLLNVGVDAEGLIPEEFILRSRVIGEWLRINGEAVYDTEACLLMDVVTMGQLTCKGNNLYLVLRFWDRRSTLRLPWLKTRVKRVSVLGCEQTLLFEQNDWELTINNLPPQMADMLFPVIKLECADKPAVFTEIGRSPLWGDRPLCYVPWARRRGESVWIDGKVRV